ncbi:hybrid sensor histidine kinase/response regulator [Massilia horti]|uniref:Chemotaxis protein CheA n=1 Tax=Massilia horti TaxID=2562153 RepID=A0A4Y9T4I4_9BURK|nr:response regulator [Massilia horti]TFW35000.1 hybrid sensor histidine kinase/response regulator [Massilia horti]
MNQDQDFSQFSMLDLFRMESESQARLLSDGLLALERGEADAAVLDALMRAAHSVKGAAAIVGLEPMVKLAHCMEDAFVALQRQGGTGAAPVDALLAGVDLMVRLAQVTEAGVPHWLAANAPAIDAAIEAIRTPGSAAPAPAPPAPVPVPATAPAPAGPPQVSHELLALASQARLHVYQLEPWIASLQRFKRQQAHLLQGYERLHEAIIASGNAQLMEQSAQLLAGAQPIKQALHRYITEVDNYERRAFSTATRLVDEVLALRMCRFGDGLRGFARMVRDLARSLGKQAQLVLEGADTLVDRDTLAAIESPLNQLLRNAIDHGLESVEERIAAGKPAQGTIRLAARHHGGMLSIELHDDGRGVDPQRIRQVVAGRGLAPPGISEALSDAELMEFLLLPGFSLKESANELSGRGVGLDLVHDVVRAQNGSVRVESEPGRAFRTLITLPLTQSILRALVVDIAGEPYALPIARVERVLKLPQSRLRTMGGSQYFEHEGAHVAVVAAADVLDLPAAPVAPELSLVVIGAGRERYALAVDAVRGEQSLIVQALEPTFGKLRDIAAASLLDDGAPVLILDVPDLLVSIARLAGQGALRQVAAEGGAQEQPRRRVLVVDDSLTVREMERKLLAGAGYLVDVALDGVDGWNTLRAGDYDLLVTDIDMPRMDGIELVSLVRADPRLRQLPVMVVSYKDRHEDRVRGLDAGADYYLAKGNFHDATLLDAVRDLVGGPEK